MGARGKKRVKRASAPEFLAIVDPAQVRSGMEALYRHLEATTKAYDCGDKLLFERPRVIEYDDGTLEFEGSGEMAEFPLDLAVHFNLINELMEAYEDDDIASAVCTRAEHLNLILNPEAEPLFEKRSDIQEAILYVAATIPVRVDSTGFGRTSFLKRLERRFTFLGISLLDIEA